MAADDRRTTSTLKDSVLDSLWGEPYRFYLYLAVTVMKWERPETPPVGGGTHPRWEAVNFQAHLGQGFPASRIQSLQPPARAGEPAVMTVNFLTLIGVNGPLPAPFSELVLGGPPGAMTGSGTFSISSITGWSPCNGGCGASIA
jgi:predicted component of type VI protein secretion system